MWVAIVVAAMKGTMMMVTLILRSGQWARTSSPTKKKMVKENKGNCGREGSCPRPPSRGKFPRDRAPVVYQTACQERNIFGEERVGARLSAESGSLVRQELDKVTKQLVELHGNLVG